ncbi:MAG: penicillin-binding protein 2 [Lachnospiraceae bacterium]|nr:penicillin-binding protein 2 [Lachnospiraceae bacterium]
MDKKERRAAKKAMKNNLNRNTVNRLGWLFRMVILAFIGLMVVLLNIVRKNSDDYQQKILAQQAYDSQTLAAKRGEIVDRNGTVLAASKERYNVILDVKEMLDADEANDTTDYSRETINALVEVYHLDEKELRQYISEVPESRYFKVKTDISYEERTRFAVLQEKPEEGKEETSLYNKYIRGVWFEKYYIRDYPQGSLACDVIGFSTLEGGAHYGLEQNYNSELMGTAGRRYGFLSDETTLEVTTIPAEDGNTLVSTIDANVQMMVEKRIREYAEEYKDNARTGWGANNIGCIIMNANNAEIYAMAGFPNFDLNDPRDISILYTDEEVALMKEEGTYADACDALWKNFCISDTYEPGSVMKPFTVAAGLETGKLTGNEWYTCTGSLEYGGFTIHCHNTYGDGSLDVTGAIAKSCNVCLMYMAEKMGADTFLEYQSIFNLGLKTNIDLAGEARTQNLVFNKNTLGPTELATASFGQGFNVTMIQMCTGYAALVNGGYYYEPHMVSKILSPGGTVVRNIEPRLIKQVISNSTSDKIREYCNAVVTGGTGWRAKPIGYQIGGKTGTAETVPRGNGEYVVSFISHAPADNPQIICYVVIDRPNVWVQEDAKYATILSKAILTDILPYLGIPMTEELTEKDIEELSELDLSVITGRYDTGVDEVGDGTAISPDPSIDLSDEAKKEED